MSDENRQIAAENMDGYLKQGLNSVQAVFNDEVMNANAIMIASAVLAVGIAWLHQQYDRQDAVDLGARVV